MAQSGSGMALKTSKAIAALPASSWRRPTINARNSGWRRATRSSSVLVPSWAYCDDASAAAAYRAKHETIAKARSPQNVCPPDVVRFSQPGSLAQ